MLTRQLRYFILVFFVFSLWMPLAYAAAPQPAPENEKQPAITLPDDVGTTIAQRAASVKTEIANRASSLFERTPIGWNWDTIEYLYKWVLGLPLKLPEFIQQIMEQSRVLGLAGSCIVFIFLAAVFYSLLGRKRILVQIEKKVQPLQPKIPPTVYPFLLSALKILVSALIPLILLAAYSLINAMIHYRAAWFQLTGKLMILWAIGSLVIGLLRESLTQNLFQATARYGKKIFQLTRLALLYGLGGFAVIQAATAFEIRPDVIALLKFAISVSIVVILFLFHLMKSAFMSFLPDLPYGIYQSFIRVLNRFYYPFIFLSFITALLWCIGYKEFGRVVLIKIWASGGAYLLIMLAYHKIRGWLQKWYVNKDASDETAQFLFQSLRTMLLYATVLATIGIILNLLGLLDLVERVISFPVVTLGKTQVTLWLILKALIILLAFIYAARLLQAYLDYKIYPSLGIDPGLGYALDTSFKYTFIAIGVLISLKIVGLDLRFLLVFAGAAGIGIGLGMQNLAANVISGFTIIFGGKIRKGDWIELENGLGLVTDIYLRATKLRTRDNIEFIVPNSNLISNTIVNYSLSSPMIRIALPVGVSYNSDPKQVEKILLEVAEKEPLVSKFQKPVVRFIAYADSSINFELLIWIDVRVTPRRQVRSALYFKIFEELRKAGIEIPFPQRDIHIRSSIAQGQL
ncbi:MAG: mechanosensitive ion channel [Desulfobacterales bacterium]|nr:MAG: mechanosensitive ion channel [Desulfobacterales bacterium]